MTQTTSPSSQVPHFAQALAAYQAGRCDEAATLFRAAALAAPQDPGVWLNLGSCLRRLGHLEAAIAASQRANALRPDHPGTLSNLGNALIDASRIDEGLALQRRALALAPTDALIARNTAVALREAGKFDEAHALFDRLSSGTPSDTTLAWEKALCLLYLGDYARGWPAFESRWMQPGMRARWPHLQRWQGEALTGKKLLITEEQGFGDTLLCSRYLPLLAARDEGASLTLACKHPLHRLLSSISGIDLITMEEAEARLAAASDAFDVQVSMMSLPGIFKTDLSSIPPPPRLNSAVTLPAEATRMLAAGEGRLRVGIVWSGSVTFANNRKRAVDAARFLPLAESDGVELYSLQKGPCERDLHACGGQHVIHEIAPLLGDFAETAAVVQQLDLVIMTDSSVAHLAGSLGTPVWNLLHDRPYWLYLQDRADSPWYPSMRLYRQPRPGDWDSVFTHVTKDLRQLAKNHQAARV